MENKHTPKETHLKILMVVHQVYDADARVRNYAEGLAQKGVKVDIICTKKSGASKSYHGGKINIYPIPLDRSKFTGNLFFEYLIAFVFYLFYVLKLYFRRHHHVIHIHNMPDFLIFSAIIPKLFGAKVILDIHDPMPEFYTAKFGNKSIPIFVKLFKVEERISSWFADHILTANANFKATLIKRGIPEKKITVINNVPDPKIFDRSKVQHLVQETNNYFTLIYPGTIAPRYGLDTAVKALPKLSKIIPNLRLLIIGAESDTSNQLIELAEKLGVSTNLVVKPAVPLDQVPVEMAQADVGIYPAIPDPHMSIAAPGKVMEYAIMGLPIISSRVKVVENMFSDRAILYHDPGDVDQFAQCVITLYSDKEMRERLTENADKEFVHVYSWEKEQLKYHQAICSFIPEPFRFL